MNKDKILETLDRIDCRVFVRWIRQHYQPGHLLDNAYEFTINGERYYIPWSDIEAGLKGQFGTVISTSTFFRMVDDSAARLRRV